MNFQFTDLSKNFGHCLISVKTPVIIIPRQQHPFYRRLNDAVLTVLQQMPYTKRYLILRQETTN